MKKEVEGLSLAGLREKLGIGLQPSDFIPERRDGQRLYFPHPEVPKHLMNETKAVVAQTALDQCIKIIGPFGERRSLIDNQEFQEGAKAFSEATKVDVLKVFDHASSCLSSLAEQ